MSAPRRPSLACGLAAALAAGLAAAPPATAGLPLAEQLRHGSADRVIVHAPGSMRLAARQEGDTLVLELPQGTSGSVPPALAGRWIRSVSSAAGQLRLLLAQGARPRLRMLADRIIIDVDDATPPLQPGQFRPPSVIAPPAAPPPPRPATVAAAKPAPPPSPPPAQPSPPAPPPPPVHPSAAAAPPPATIAAAALAPPPSDPPAASVSLVPDDPLLGGPTILLPAAKLTGAAAFTRGGELRVVLDAPVLLDLSQLKDDAVFGGATERLLPDASELRLRTQPGVTPRLARRDGGWQLTLASRSPPAALVTGQAAHGILSLAAAASGHVVAVEDEMTGGRLLVGTQRDGGQRVVAGHRAAEWALLPSWQGVVIQPLSDRVRLLGKPAGFDVLATDPPALAVVWPAPFAAIRADGRAMTRRFDFPDLPVPMLRTRLAAALRDAAITPLASRTPPRLRVAEAMLACGMDAEAQAVLQVTAADDPAAMRDPAWQGLSAIAAWLAAHAGGAAAPPPAFDTASLGDSDEAMLWRSLWGSAADTPKAAAVLGASWRLLLDYPAELRRRMLPEVADLLGRGGQEPALADLLAASADPSLDVARAGQKLRQGKAEDSLRLLDRIASGNDRLARAQALEQAVEQRLAAGRLTPKAAADQLDRQIYAWRGGEREQRLRLRTAALHAQAGDWRQALALLHETDTLFPESHAAVHAAELAVVAALLQGGKAAQLGALDLFALADAASSLLGAAQSEAALSPLLADRLLALDLPERAEPILRTLLDRAAGGPAEAGLGLRLAGLLADQGETAGALAALDRSGAGPVDADLTERRTLLHAQLLARAGRPADALAGLGSFTDRPAVELQAGIREAMHDWSGAEHALCVLADGGALPAGARQAVILRAARDASEAGDMAGLHDMRIADTALFAGSASAGLFAVLTAEPVERVADLPRAGRELGTIRGLTGVAAK